MRFEERHVIITGGSSGIGKATARLLATRGAHVTIVARTRTTLDAAAAEILAVRRAPSQRVLALAADVSVRDEIEAALTAAAAQMGPPDALIASAGIAHPGYFRELPVEVFERTMAVNYFGTLYAIRAVLPAMEARRQGHLVLVSSGAGLVGIYGYTPYAPSKFALRGLAESLRGEVRAAGIGVSIVYPPDTDTPQLVAENRTKPPETRRITATATTWSAAGVARAIVRGVERGTFAITPGLEMALLARLHSLLGPSLQWYFDRLATQTPRR